MGELRRCALVEGVFTSAHVVLTEDRGKLVVLHLHGGVVDSGEVCERVLVLAGLVGGDVRLEESDFRGVKAVGVAPSGEKGLGVVGLGVLSSVS